MITLFTENKAYWLQMFFEIKKADPDHHEGGPGLLRLSYTNIKGKEEWCTAVSGRLLSFG